MSQQAVSADIIPNSAVGIFFQKTEGTNHKVLIYIEHHSVCPLVGIGTPPPL
jgi:hypothetical protein